MPKLFISYSWTDPDHEKWVLDLATELRDSGVDAILDKWDLREGQDSVAFMEQMVTDPTVTKVIMICDKKYSEKTDGRKGGVGTEAQIISAKIYSSTDQKKFVAVVKERDNDGNAYLPSYYASRIYIDLSDTSTYATNFEQLLRWIYDKPLYVKPTLGKKPEFLSESEDSTSLGTSSLFRRAIDAVRGNKEYADGAVSEYFSQFCDSLRKFRLTPIEDEPFDETVYKSIENFLPYRNQVLELITATAQFRDRVETQRLLHRLFERLAFYLDRDNVSAYVSDDSFDNFRFVVPELFLHTIATLIRFERFEAVAQLLDKYYYVPSWAWLSDDSTIKYTSLQRGVRSFEERNNRLQLRRLSLEADLLKQRCEGSSVTFLQLMQADFLLYLRASLDDERYSRWYPCTMVFAERHASTFEVFARSRSRSYFVRMRVMLNITDLTPLQLLVSKVEQGEHKLPTFGYFATFNLKTVLGIDNLCTSV